MFFTSCTKDDEYKYSYSSYAAITDSRLITLTLDGEPLSNAEVHIIAVSDNYYFRYLGNNWGETGSEGTRVYLGENTFTTDTDGVFTYTYVSRDKYIICVDIGTEYYFEEFSYIPESINFESK